MIHNVNIICDHSGDHGVITFFLRAIYFRLLSLMSREKGGLVYK